LPKEDLLRSLLAHQRVLESLMAERSVLPLEFGTWFESDSQVRELLAARGDELGAHLERLRDWLQMEVAVTWDTAWALAEIAGEAEVANAREAIAAAGEPASLDDRVRLGRLVKAHLDLRREAVSRRILETLRPMAIEVATNPLLSEQLVANIAVLVERSRVADLEASVRELDAAFEGRLTFRMIGPMPPYTFNTIGVRRVSRQQVNAACRLLELDASCRLTAGGVRHSYRRLAAAAHDRAERLGSLREACALLVAVDTEAAAPGRDDHWLISVRRPPLEDIQPSRFGGGAGL
jgi:hypothetical protein